MGHLDSPQMLLVPPPLPSLPLDKPSQATGKDAPTWVDCCREASIFPHLGSSLKFLGYSQGLSSIFLPSPIPLALATGPKPIMQCDACKRHFTKPHYLFVHKQLHEVGTGMGELKVRD